MKSALPMDEESDEEEIDNQEATPLLPIIPQPPTLVTSNLVKKVSKTETLSSPKEEETEKESNNVENVPEKIEENENKESPKIETKNEDEDSVSIKRNGVLDEDDPILEMIDLTEDEKKTDVVKSEFCYF